MNKAESGEEDAGHAQTRGQAPAHTPENTRARVHTTHICYPRAAAKDEPEAEAVRT